MNTKFKKNLGGITAILAGAVLMLTFVAAATAQNYDPPSRVARIRYLQGSVSFRPAGENDWVSAVTNRPMTTGDQIWADAGSRAEVQIGSAMIRVDENTGFSFLNLDDQTTQIQLTDGTLNLRVKRIRPNEVFEVDTPNQAFTVTRAGQYRVEAAADGNSSMVVVRQGQGEVTGGGRTYYVASGQSSTFVGTDSIDGYVARAPDLDDFDNWGQTRDHQYEGSQSARYVSPDVVGYEDLDNNGSWHSDPRYGNVWTPTSVPSGWAPYRDGHWAWVDPWGWTWVDDAPWGYAPFHYGRWVSERGNWGWVPGPVNYEPVYAPALVAFIGGPGFASMASGGEGGYGGGNVGWFPLGPQEVYVPSYNVSPAYANRVNVSNTNVSSTTITQVFNDQVTHVNNSRPNINYVNRAVPGAVTAVPQNAFRSAQPVARAAVPLDAKQIASAPVVTRAAVAPTQNSVLGATAASANRVTRPPQAIASRPVVAKTTPPSPPVPFVKQQQELAKHPGQPLAPREVQSLRQAAVAATQPQVKQAPPSKQATLSTSRPPSQPVAGNAKQAATAQAPANKPGNAPIANAPAPPVRNDRPASAQQQAAQQQADKAKQQSAAQQQAAQQQAAEKARAEQAAQQQADKAKAQQAVQQQAAQQQAAEKARAEQAAQQQADKAKQQSAAQQQAAQQQAAEKARAEQAAQQQADRAKQQLAAQQQAAQQQATEKARAEQAAQQQADKAKQQSAAQQQAAQQQAAEKARAEQAAQQQADKAKQQSAVQQQAAQQQAEKSREQQAQRAQQQQPAPQRTDRPPSAQPAEQTHVQPAQPAATPANRPLTPAEKAREEQLKKQQEEKPPPQ